MKLKDIATRYNIDKDDFMLFIYDNNLPRTETFTSYIIDDKNVDSFVKMYKDFKLKEPILIAKEEERIKAEEDQKKAEEVEKRKIALETAEKIAQEEMKKRKAMAEMLITSGFNFDGYKITKYSGYISGDDAVSVDRGLAIFGAGTNVKDKLMESLVTIRRNALTELKEAAYALGCNAVIGVDFDYLTLDPQTANIVGGTTYQPYIFGVTANGNAVIIEKIDE